MSRAGVQIIQGGCQSDSLSFAGFSPTSGSKVTEDSVYIWCDYICIAQDHRPTQMMAVSSLSMCSSIADVFVIIAPPAVHMDSGRSCNIDTYNLRGWCRAEMLSKVCGTGLKQMFVSTSSDGGMEPMSEAWLDRLDFKVFRGDLTCCCLGHTGSRVCDKQSLIGPMLGLYSLILRQRHCDSARAVLRFIDESKAEFFPETFEFLGAEGPLWPPSWA